MTCVVIVLLGAAVCAGEPIAPAPIRGSVTTAVFDDKSIEPEEKKRKSEGIQDNSFLIEEAYNQEPGVVQHIFFFKHDVNKLRGPNDRTFSLAFTQEWPVVSQRHQLSYTLLYATVDTAGQYDNGIQDVMLNYRYQALMESDTQPAFAPRLSFILPTGDKDKGFGNETVGYQISLPVSKVLNDSWTVHFNAGATILPGVNVDLEDGSRSPKRTLVSYNAGASAIYAVTRNFNLMCESTGSWDQQFNDRGRLHREFSAIISPGMRYGISLPKARDAQLVFGVAAPIGLNSTAPDYGVIGYISFEHNF